MVVVFFITITQLDFFVLNNNLMLPLFCIVFCMNKFKVSSKLVKIFDEKGLAKLRDVDSIVEALCDEEALKKKYLNELLEEDEEDADDEDDEETKQWDKIKDM